MAAANEALDTWGNPLKWSWVRRAEVVDAWVQQVRKHQAELALLMAVESGKHLDESRADVVEAIHMLQYCAGRGRQPIGERVASEIPDKEAEIHLAPRGVCTVITPWNFPAAIPTWLIGPALVCGNPVVFKPSEETPLTAQYLVRLFDLAAREHGAPPGVLSLVFGPGPVGEHLVRHPDTVGQLFYVNLPTIGAEVHLPFGGMKRSGTGMPSAAWLFNYMCHATAFTVNYAEEIRMAQGLSAEV